MAEVISAPLVPHPPSPDQKWSVWGRIKKRYRIGLKWKISFLVVLLLVMIVAVIRYTVINRMRDELLEETKNTAVAMLKSIIKPAGETFSTGIADPASETGEPIPNPEELIGAEIDEKILQSLALSTVNRHPAIRKALILDHKNRIRAYHEKDLSIEVLQKRQKSLGLELDLGARKKYVTTTTLPRLTLMDADASIVVVEDPKAKSIEFETPIVAFKKTFGKAIVGVSTQKIEQKTVETMEYVIKMFIAVFFLGLIGAFLEARVIVEPIKLLVRGTDEIAKGNFAHRVPVMSRDEVGDLSVHYNHMAAGLQQREQMKGAFGRLVSKDVMSEIMEDLDQVKVRGERREITILFSDVRGFTSHSEKMQPEDVTALLNEYFDCMAEIVFRNKGTIDKYIGDGLMCLFGAPKRYGNDAFNAVMAAVEMREAVKLLQKKWKEEGKPIFEIGVGVNTGDVTVGFMGSHQKMEYTVIGDPVNLASRLEGLNKDFGTTVIVSEFTCEKLNDAFELRELGEAKVKGKTKAVKVFEVVNLRQPADAVSTPSTSQSAADLTAHS